MTRAPAARRHLLGALSFARFAYPPNALGYCGPDADRTLLEYGATGEADEGLASLARDFDGAWPYLRLIADANRIADPLDARVVEAYWVGNRLLERVDAPALGGFLERRFRPRAGAGWAGLAPVALSGALPHHNLHVFGVYPWVGLLRLGRSEEPLRILDRCRVRWGTVERIDGATVVVRSRGLSWDGRRLSLGPDRREKVLLESDGLGFVRDVQPDDVVAMHWNWVCDRLSARRLASLRLATYSTLRAVNGVGAPPAPAAILE